MWNINFSACELCKPTTRQGLKNKPECACILVDGIERTVFSVNRMIPGPQIQVSKYTKNQYSLNFNQ